MALKNYYFILGVPRGADARRIRSAYRNRAKTLHPDRAGNRETGSFQDLAEAYEVLSDPARRRRYDLEWSHQQAGRRPSPQPPTRHDPVVSSRLRPPVSILEDFRSFSPSFDALDERLLRNFTGVGAAKSEHEEALNIEVVLDPDEARTGALLPLEVPVFHACPRCRGEGGDWLSTCGSCAGRGVTRTAATVGIRIPPLARHGQVYETSLHDLGIHNLFLRLHVLIGEE
jgi:DnaJ-class molecular chaperone